MPLTSGLDRKTPPFGLQDELDFAATFPDDESCLEFLWIRLHASDGEHASCPRCKRIRQFRRYVTYPPRKSWTCTTCGFHLHPTVGTIFERSATSLRLWFFAIFMVASSKYRVTARGLQRQLGVTYKTAWRMLHLIKERAPEPAALPQLFAAASLE